MPHGAGAARDHRFCDDRRLNGDRLVATKPPLVEVISGGEVNGASAFTVDGPGAAVIQDLAVAGVTANGFGVGVDVLASPSVTVQRNQFGVLADANAVAGPLMRAGVRITGGEKDRRVSQNLISRGGCPRRAMGCRALPTTPEIAWVAAAHYRSPTGGSGTCR